MSVSFHARLDPVAILSGTSASRWVSGAYEYADATCLTIGAPAALDSLTFTIEVSYDESTAMTLNDGSADIGPPAAGKARQYVEMLGFPYWRIKASGNTAVDRTFLVGKQWTA